MGKEQYLEKLLIRGIGVPIKFSSLSPIGLVDFYSKQYRIGLVTRFVRTRNRVNRKETTQNVTASRFLGAVFEFRNANPLVMQLRLVWPCWGCVQTENSH